MKVGVKIGPENWKQVLSEVTPACVELWFKLDLIDQYDEMVAELQKRTIPFGIHFWASTKKGYEPNLVFEEDGVADESEELMRQTIDYAKAVRATYVNVHPGSFTLKYIDFEKKKMVLIPGETVEVDQGKEVLFNHCKSLNEYAKSKNILFLVETLPKNELEHWYSPEGRKNTQPADNVSPEILLELAKSGISITNDFSHTVSSVVSDDREFLWKYLLDTTKQLAPFTKLIHLNTVIAPFNGTDSHNGVLPEDFAQNVLPTKEQVLKLLQLFKGRDDVWVIPEPDIEKMVANYRAIGGLLA